MVTGPSCLCADKLGSWRRGEERLERLFMFDLVAQKCVFCHTLLEVKWKFILTLKLSLLVFWQFIYCKFPIKRLLKLFCTGNCTITIGIKWEQEKTRRFLNKNCNSGDFSLLQWTSCGSVIQLKATSFLKWREGAEHINSVSEYLSNFKNQVRENKTSNFDLLSTLLSVWGS